MKYPQLLSMPTAVSDWLEEQLEARGIDAVVYTRYVLSILYRDPVDVICSERELQFSPQPNNKEVRRSSSGRKRFRRSSGWYTLNLSDAEKLKRSAAVQCLMSASDQECGFESLVDELCEKLKQVNRGISPESPTKELEKNQSVDRTSSPADLVKRYYAAFPALSNDSPGIINLIPKWLGSPKKRHNVRKQQTVKPDTEMKKPATSRLQKFKQFKKHFNQYNFKYAKKIEEKDFWDFYNCENNKNLMMDEIENNNKVADDDWRCSDDNLTMYDDMIQDNIRNLLDSPVDNNRNEDEVAVEMMNMANMKQEGNKHIEHHSMFFDETIWSCSKFEDTEDFLQNKLKAISIDAKPIQCCSVENEKNTIFENQQSFFSIWPIEKWSEHDEKTTTEDIHDQMRSLSVINHSETSLFKKVIHKPHENHAAHHVATPPPRKITKIDENYVDLWDSHQCRFKPIGETIVPGMNQYEDGMTFRVNSDFEKIDWRKTSAGFFYVNDDPLQRKYLEFNREPKKLDGDGFVPKYLVKQDDERLQTESSSPKARRKLCFSSESEDDELNGYLSPAVDDENEEDEKNESEDDDAVDDDGDESETVIKNSCSCSKIGWDVYWNNMENKMLDKDVIKNIWKSGESCLDCEKRQKEEKLTMEGIQSKLREECILDGEQLLLDLNSKSYLQ
ncbi:uncharacterized protein [Onthophagus taurus]|uniref:uncharacterized protein isoform X2 n=1 Tax=Onthophagus taurus TaxID=166361 RepID=UPI0039BDD104